MRNLLPIAMLLCAGTLRAQQCTILLDAPELAGRMMLLQQYDDLVTLRTVTLERVRIGSDGKATFTPAVDAPVKATLRTMDQRADLYLVPGATYDIRLTPMPGSRPRTLGGAPNLAVEFIAPDPFDLNILYGDLNERLDAFVAEDLATDQVAGMQALEVVRKDRPDTSAQAQRPPTLFLTPTWSKARVDSFEQKLRRFYAEVEDKRFWRRFDLALGGLRIGPQASEKELFEKYLKDRPVAHDDGEYVRFVRTLFQDHIMVGPFRKDEAKLKRAIKDADIATLKALFMQNDHLASHEVLCELVLMDGLYGQYHGREFDRGGILECLRKLSEGAVNEANRRIAGNMLHDLTAMQRGTPLPAWELPLLDGGSVKLDSLSDAPHCIVLTASWCKHCDLELTALAQLHEEYGDFVRVLVIGMDATLEATLAQRARHRVPDWQWVYAGDDPAFMEAMRARSLPVFFLSSGSSIAHAPAEMPSRGLGATLHTIKASQQQGAPSPGGSPPKPAPR